jgi:lipoprotein-anchoring transpeptidase ErfK/SrfK
LTVERLKCVTGVELMGLHVTTVNLRMASEHQRTDGGWLTRTILTVASLLVLVAEPAWAQNIYPFGPPASRHYQYFAPPAPANRQIPSKAANVQIPRPENTAIGEEYAKGDIVIVNHERSLYFVEEPGHAIRYPVAIGKLDDQWEGVETITAKRENPQWFPSEDIQWEMGVPPTVPPGPQNPLGPRALYLGDTLYRIHGTNRPGSIGGAVSHGCFRMHNPHIIELYEKVQIGANVHVVP